MEGIQEAIYLGPGLIKANKISRRLSPLTKKINERTEELSYFLSLTITPSAENQN
jgi:hypothetical protein